MKTIVNWKECKNWPGLYSKLSSPAANSSGDTDFSWDHGKDETSNTDEDCQLLDWNWRPTAEVLHSETTITDIVLLQVSQVTHYATANSTNISEFGSQLFTLYGRYS